MRLGTSFFNLFSPLNSASTRPALARPKPRGIAALLRCRTRRREGVRSRALRLCGVATVLGVPHIDRRERARCRNSIGRRGGSSCARSASQFPTSVVRFPIAHQIFLGHVTIYIPTIETDAGANISRRASRRLPSFSHFTRERSLTE